PGFRIIATARPPTNENDWFSGVVVNMFDFVAVRFNNPVPAQDPTFFPHSLQSLLRHAVPGAPPAVVQVLCRLWQLCAQLSHDSLTDINTELVTLRQMIRLARNSQKYESRETLSAALA